MSPWDHLNQIPLISIEGNCDVTDKSSNKSEIYDENIVNLVT